MKISMFNIKTETEFLKNRSHLDINEINENGETVLFESDFEKISWLLKYNVNINYQNPYNGCNALYTEYEIETSERTRLLIDSGININSLNKNKETPLFYMYKKESKRLLIEAGINIHQINAFGLDALHSADINTATCLISKGINILRYPSDLNEICEMVKYHSVGRLIKEARDALLVKMTKEEKEIILSKMDINIGSENKIKRI